jgi:hypothetical protein
MLKVIKVLNVWLVLSWIRVWTDCTLGPTHCISDYIFIIKKVLIDCENNLKIDLSLSYVCDHFLIVKTVLILLIREIIFKAHLYPYRLNSYFVAKESLETCIHFSLIFIVVKFRQKSKF